MPTWIDNLQHKIIYGNIKKNFHPLVVPVLIIMSFQIFHLVRHFTNLTKHNLLTDNTLKKTT